MKLAVSAPGVCPLPWFASGRGVAQSFYFFLQGHHCGQCSLVGFPYIGKTPFYQRLPPLPLKVQLWGGWMSIDWCQATASDAFLCLCPWQSSKEDTTSSNNSGSPGGDPGSLLCLYTSRYKDCNSSLLLWELTSWMADKSTSGSSFGSSF